MGDTAKRTETATGLARRITKRQVATVEQYGQALERYAGSLRRYADGEITGGALGKDVVNLVVDQATRTRGRPAGRFMSAPRWRRQNIVALSLAAASGGT
jgi:hypothetical protein